MGMIVMARMRDEDKRKPNGSEEENTDLGDVRLIAKAVNMVWTGGG
jgi:hypothetical protein